MDNSNKKSEIRIYLPNDEKRLEAEDTIILKKCELLCCEPESALDPILKIQHCGKCLEQESTSDNENLDKGDPFAHIGEYDDRSLIGIENIGNMPLNLLILPAAYRHGIENPVVLESSRVYVHDGAKLMRNTEGVSLTLDVNSNKKDENIIRMYLRSEDDDISIEFLNTIIINGVYITFMPGDQRKITQYDKICIGTKPIVQFEAVNDYPWVVDYDVWG